MERKYLSVAEFAEAAGITTQAVYAQIKRGKLRNYSKNVNGKRKVSISALALYTPDKPEDPAADPGEPVADPEEPAAGSEPEKAAERVAESESLALIRELLAEKDARIAELKERLTALEEMQRQMLDLLRGQMVTQHALITVQTPDEGQAVADPAASKGTEDPAAQTPAARDPEQIRAESGPKPASRTEKKRPGSLSRWLKRS